MGAFEAESEPQSEGSAARRLEEPSPRAASEWIDADAVTPIPVGELVSGRWVVDGVLGHGAMGVVCAAHHVDLGQRVAVKFLRATCTKNEAIVERFLGEARAAAALRGEHIVRVFDIGQTSTGLPYFVMEYLEGITLEAKIRREGAISPHRAIDYLLQACDGLREVHTAGIVHRDVKPENLFLASTGGTRKEIVKIVDFGIAKRLDARAKIVTGPQDRIGSPCYMSPEQMASPKTVDPRTDVWALGVVLYQSLTGRLPFDGDTLEEMFERIQSAEVVPPSTYQGKVDFGLDAIVARCLKKDPGERFQSIEELAAELERFRSPAEWRTSTVDEQIWRPASRSDAPVVAATRHRPRGSTWPVAIAAVFGAALTLAGTVFVLTSRDSSDVGGVLAAAPPARPELTDVNPAKNPAPAMMQPLGAIPTRPDALAPIAEPTQPQAIVAEREVKRDPAELAKRRRQARARAQAAAARGEVPVAAPTGEQGAPAPTEPAAPPVTQAAEDAPVPSGDDSYPDYLKRNGWRPLRDVLSEIDRSPQEPPQRAAPPEAEARPSPPAQEPAPPPQEPEPPAPGGNQPEP